ncbi:FAS1 domain-containing protein SELMODRAFT_448915-like [Nymphaea colorata]|uniref:FAS1 domain-containing protein n=1 Tax=Nymphaea colorata TaxID=210225 RepID=A0A5K1CL10_9MAGN|nr:FAS1 domain-containing protein SELMODRAFT_448915-like [Nymphaea colorata]
MAPNLSLLLLMGIIVGVFADDEPPQRVDISVAITEMQEANYYTFVTLIQMLQDSIPENATFLMPSDRILARVQVNENAISEFVRSHMIPSPLVYEQLKRFPSGSLIPTYYPSHMLRISTHNRRILLNNVQIVRPNVCTAGSSIRCHGINGVLVHTSESDRPATPNPPSTAPSPPSQTATPNISPVPPMTPPSAEEDGAPSPTMEPQSVASNLMVGREHFVSFISCAAVFLSVVF